MHIYMFEKNPNQNQKKQIIFWLNQQAVDGNHWLPKYGKKYHVG